MQSQPALATYPLTHQAPVYDPYAQPKPQQNMNLPVSTPTYPGNYNANPGYGHPGGYNQFNTYNNYGSNYYNPGAANSYYPSPSYPAPPANYPVPLPSHTPYNPYANIPNNANQISLGTPGPTVAEATVTPQKQPDKVAAKPSSVKYYVT